jgi:hypothetical protein
MKTVQEAFHPIIGKPAWQVKCGHGSFITLEFGDPELEILEPKMVEFSESEKIKKEFSKRRIYIKGQWQLWLQYCNWKITTRSNLFANNDSNHDTINNCLNEVGGQILQSVEENESSAGIQLKFDLGACIDISPSPHFIDDIQWEISNPDKTTYSYMSDGRFIKAE